MYSTGEKPGKGVYKCSKCGKEINLNESSDTLPPCPVCNNTKWNKIGILI